MDTILFDLDGTLLPMDQDKFMAVYLPALAEKCTAFGFGQKAVMDAVFVGIKAMVYNDGTATNEQRFWDAFAGGLGDAVLERKPELVRFYENEFHATRVACGPNPLAAPLVRSLRKAGYTLVLASNPVFPANAYHTRLSWIGLEPGDFDYLTSYDQYHYCKPNPAYYSEILRTIGKKPQECMMVGNDVQEDGAAAEAGVEVHLITDNLMNSEGADFSHLPSVSFEQFCRWADRHLLSRCG